MDIIDFKDLDQVFRALRERGYTVIAPTIRDGAIVLDTITKVSELPIGWGDVQSGGSYALERRTDDAAFGYVVGPFSWKRLLFQPRMKLFSATRTGKEVEFSAGSQEIVGNVPKLAFLGVRPCELSAITIQDRVFMAGEYVDPTYAALRSQALIIAVNCLEPGGTCFCASMGTGPRAEAGFDLALTEVIEGGAHYFTAETGGPRGQEVLTAVSHRPATSDEQDRIGKKLTSASQHMGRTLKKERLKETLYDGFEDAEWNSVATRCMTCANCTLVCPTCFCSTVEDTTDLAGTHAERWRRWDSCFTMDFARVAGGNTRPSTRARYRQWLMHKLGYWNDQFGVSGCVGCGRCITWCPVGIDITAEAAAIQGGSTSQTSSAPAGNSRQ